MGLNDLEKDQLEELNCFARTLDPSARVLIKDDSPLMKALNVFVRVFNKTFMTTYATTICNRVYIPRSWLGRDLRRLLVHEVGGHVRQCRACGLGIHPWVGFPIYMLLYAIVFFPLGLAWPRYRFELGADARAWEWSLDHGESYDSVRERAKSFAQTVGSWDYLRPWPSTWVYNGFMKRVEKEIRKPRAKPEMTTEQIRQAELLVRKAPFETANGASAKTLDEFNPRKDAFEAWWKQLEVESRGAKGREPPKVAAWQAWDAGWRAGEKKR
jgi:hypothetical protein